MTGQASPLEMTAPTTRRRRRGPVAALLMSLIGGYQRVTSWKPTPCRFVPSCSNYAMEALEVHGAWRGSGLTLRRLARCHPWGPSGPDPVPKRTS